MADAERVGDPWLLGTPSFRPARIPLASPGESGGKGAGLLRLPPAWYPPTLVISIEAHRAYKSGRLPQHFLSESSHASDFSSALSSMGKLASNDGMLFVRSSANEEGMAERGKYESRAAAADVEAIETTVRAMWDEIDDPSVDLGLLIQPFLDPKVAGHLSNEHRVSRDATSWVSDMEVGRSVQSRNWRVTNSVPAADASLICETVGALEPRLREVAKRLSELPTRHHLEWIWSRDRLWVVQADRVPQLVGLPPGEAWQPAIGTPLSGVEFAVWRLLEGQTSEDLRGWPKARALNEFARAQLPTAQILRLQGEDLIDALAEGRPVNGLFEDLETICSGHIVVRTDLRDADEAMMLPKTGTESDPAAVETFLRSTSSLLRGAGIAADSISFLAHRFLRARACAWTLARPQDPYIEVDSMWGTPDGLAWLPHDSAWVNVDTSEVRRSIEGKTSFLDVDESEQWTYRETPTEWIWRSSMTEDQLRTVAAGASRLAKLVQEPVMTMWFVGMLDGGEADCLPWYQTRAIPPREDEYDGITRASERASIRSRADLETFDRDYSSGSAPVLRLEPGAELVRDRSFVDSVIDVANRRDVRVELVGSSLAHPYYVLRAAGITVSCVGRFEQPHVRFDKLVRDNVVEQIESNGETVVSYVAPQAERARLLRLKAVEEAMELLRAQSLDETVAEMADLEEVIAGLRKALGVSRDELRFRQNEKRRRRGGFDAGRVLVSAGRRQPDSRIDLEPLFDEPARGDRRWQVQQRPESVLLSNLPPLAGEQHSFTLRLGEKILSVEYADEYIELRIAADLSQGLDPDVTLF